MQDEINKLNEVIGEAVDGADQPHQEILNQKRYCRMRDDLTLIREAMQVKEKEVVRIKDMGDTPYVDGYIQRSAKTESSAEDALATVDVRGMTLMHAAMGVTKESGEIADLVNERVFCGTRLDPTRLKDELGDLMWYVMILVREYDLSFEEILLLNLKKLDAKYPEAGVLGDAPELESLTH